MVWRWTLAGIRVSRSLLHFFLSGFVELDIGSDLDSVLDSDFDSDLDSDLESDEESLLEEVALLPPESLSTSFAEEPLSEEPEEVFLAESGTYQPVPLNWTAEAEMSCSTFEPH